MPRDLVKAPAIKSNAQKIGSPELYSDMLEYIRKSPKPDEIAGDLLKPGRPIEEHNLHATEYGADFFLALSEFDLKGTLAFLDRFINPKSRSELRKFKCGKRQAIAILERAAMREELFEDSARLLLALGEAGSRDGNDAANAFASLFWPEYHDDDLEVPLDAAYPVCPKDQNCVSNVSLTQRLSVLEKALRSDSKRRQLLAIDAYKFALGSRMFSSYCQDYEIDLYNRSVENILESSLKRLDARTRQKTLSTILGSMCVSSARTSSCGSSLIIEIVHSTCTSYNIVHIKDLYGDKIANLIITGIIEKYHVPERLAKKIRKIHDRVTKTDHWFLLNLEYLARRAFFFDLHIPEREWNERIPIDFVDWQLGHSLGKVDKDFEMLSTILEVQKNTRNPNVGFLKGYFGVLHEKNLAKWESCLDLMLNDSILRKFVVPVTDESIMTERAGRRIISLIKKYNLDYDVFCHLNWPHADSSIFEPVVAEWIEFLLNKGEPRAMDAAVGFLFMYLSNAKTVPQNLMLRVLLHNDVICRLFVIGNKCDENYAIFLYTWSWLVGNLVKQHPDKSIAVAETVFEYYIKNAPSNRWDDKTLTIDETARAKSLEVWEAISPHIEKLLLNKKNLKVTVVMDLFSYFVHDSNQALQDFMLHTLLDKNSIDKLLVSRQDEMFASKWAKASLKFAKECPDRSVAITKAVLEYHARDMPFDQYDPEVYKVLNEIARTRPAQVWEIISRHIGPPVDSKAFRIRTWLKKEGLFKSKSELFEDIPSEIVWP